MSLSLASFLPMMLSLVDILVDSHTHPQYMAVHLKTDTFGAGVTLYLGSTNNNLCLVSVMLAYLAIDPTYPVL